MTNTNPVVFKATYTYELSVNESKRDLSDKWIRFVTNGKLEERNGFISFKGNTITFYASIAKSQREINNLAKNFESQHAGTLLLHDIAPAHADRPVTTDNMYQAEILEMILRERPNIQPAMRVGAIEHLDDILHLPFGDVRDILHKPDGMGGTTPLTKEEFVLNMFTASKHIMENYPTKQFQSIEHAIEYAADEMDRLYRVGTIHGLYEY